MISVEEALTLVTQQQRYYGVEKVGLLQCVGRILATDVTADRDYPAFNRVMMDGIAINNCAQTTSFTIQAIQAAGLAPLALINNNNCIEVMTGAVLPGNTNAVIPYEEISIRDSIATTKQTNVKPFQNIHVQGCDSKEHDVLLTAGTKLTAAHVGIFASVGMYNVPVKKLPRVAICSTGNELVEVHEQPLPHQIRTSNGYMLAAALLQEGIMAPRYHFADDEVTMTAGLKDIIDHNDVVLLSGAVSKGKFDYLPGVLTALGMVTIFHRISQRPGKPMLFGLCTNGTVIFGLPGNPMSTFVCYQLYFRAWLYSCLQYQLPVVKARLAKTIEFTPNLSYHIPVVLQNNDGVLSAMPMPGSNSGDIPSLSNTEGLVTLQRENSIFQEGLTVNVVICK